MLLMSSPEIPKSHSLMRPERVTRMLLGLMSAEREENGHRFQHWTFLAATTPGVHSPL